MPRFRVACKNEMATNQSPTVRPTAFPEDIGVGKDGAAIAVVSSEIPVVGEGPVFRCSSSAPDKPRRSLTPPSRLALLTD
jgi:hypothetical protein